jgi:hypothetical protein
LPAEGRDSVFYVASNIGREKVFFVACYIGSDRGVYVAVNVGIDIRDSCTLTHRLGRRVSQSSNIGRFREAYIANNISMGIGSVLLVL